MPFKTMQQLITETERALYQSAGPGVQIYAQDVLQNKLQKAFNHCFSDKFWPYFVRRETKVLSGVLGLLTTPPTLTRDWEDIKHVFREGSTRPLPHIPTSFNTLSLTGTTARYIEATGDSNILRFYPLTAVGNVQIVSRLRPAADFILTDTVPFDETALIHFAAWWYFADDDSNPAAAATHQGLFENRMKQLESAAFGNSVELNPNQGFVPDQWYER